MNSPVVPTGRRNSIVEKVSIAKRRLSLESSDAVNDTLRKKFAHWTAPAPADGRRLSIDRPEEASSPLPQYVPQIFTTPESTGIASLGGNTTSFLKCAS